MSVFVFFDRELMHAVHSIVVVNQHQNISVTVFLEVLNFCSNLNEAWSNATADIENPYGTESFESSTWNA